jgi:hypothetical protein
LGRPPLDYSTVPGSGEVVGLIPYGAIQVPTLAPLHDIFGSTLGLVGSSNTLQTQWSYEPFGAPTLSGTQSSFPFLFGGGQYDPTGYYGDYSPRLQHSLSGGAKPYGGNDQPGAENKPRHSPPGGGVSAYQYFKDSWNIVNDFFFGVDDNGGARFGFDKYNPGSDQLVQRYLQRRAIATPTASHRFGRDSSAGSAADWHPAESRSQPVPSAVSENEVRLPACTTGAA